MNATFRTSFFAMHENFVPRLLAGSEAKARMTAHQAPGAISISGVLGSASDWFSDTAYESIRAQVRRAAADPSVRTIDLLIDSPGGSVLGLPETADVIA